METEGVRRSTRTSKPVQRYAVDQAQETAATSRAGKGKRKKIGDDDDTDEVAPTPLKKTAKKTKAPPQDMEDDNDFEPEETHEKISSSKSKSKSKRVIKQLYSVDGKPSSSKPTRTDTDDSWHADAAQTRIAAEKRKVEQLAPGQAEKRLRPYVDDPPQSYHNALKKATKERMYVLDRERTVEEDCHALHNDCPQETLQIAGSKGSVYTINISHLPTCNCPAGLFNRKGEEKTCKHVIYVLHNVLKAPAHLKQQNAFLTSELKEIFSNAPALPSQVAEDDPMDGNRKPIEDDCAICASELDEDEDIVWCRAACGNNIHKTCFEQWAKMKPGQVTCPFCRSIWQDEAPKTQKVSFAAVSMLGASRGTGGYLNVRDQLEYD